MLFIIGDGALQYDDYSITYQTSSENKRRSSYTLRPEEATVQDTKYHVCSEFVHNVFYEAFLDDEGNHYELKGKNNVITHFTYDMIELVNSSSAYYKSNMFVDYISVQRGVLASNTAKYKKRILEEIEPGDIIVYRRTFADGSTTGHAMIYLGDGVVLHSIGKSYNYLEKKDNLEDVGTILKLDLEKDVLVNKSGMLFNTNVTRIGIIRPLNEILDKGYKISEETLARMQHNKLVRTKTASVEKYDNINLGDEITYKIKLENVSSTEDYENIKVTDTIPENTEFVKLTGDGTNINGNLTWNLNVPHGEIVEISYTVKVKKDKSLLGKSIINDKTVADGIALNTIETIINTTLTSDYKDKILSIVSRTGESFTRTEDFINTVYTEFTFPSTEELLSMFFSKKTINVDGLTSNYNAAVLAGDAGKKDVFVLKNKSNFLDADKTFTNMYVKGLFGGIYTITENEPNEDDGRNYTYTSETFTIGDILVIYDDDYKTDKYISGEKNMYLYIDTNKFATVKNGKVIVIESTDASTLIDSLVAQNCFIVLRPSNSLDRTVPIISSVSGNQEEWTSGNVTLTITATDDGSNLASKAYSFDGGETWQAENTKTYTENTSNIVIKVKDTVGNIAIYETINITKIDKTKPTVNVTGNPTKWTSGNVTLTVTATDDGSGLASKAYSFDGGETWQVENTKTYTENTSNIVIKVKDAVGNIAEYEKVSITKIMKLESIGITKIPEKTTYIEGEKFEAEGMEITAAYNNGDKKVITDYKVTDGENLSAGKTSITISYTEAGITKTLEQKITVLERLKVSFEEYEEVELDNKNHIKHIKVNETIEEMKENITTNGEIKIYQGEKEIANTKETLATGMKVKITLREESKEYTVIVTGDANGDGQADLHDILAVNRHRLNKTLLEGEYLLAGDVTRDGKVNLNDILKINRYRLGKIDSL